MEPVLTGTSTRFLNVLLPRLVVRRGSLPAVELAGSGEGADAVRVGNTVVVFARRPGALDAVELDLSQPAEVILVDAAPGMRYRVGGRTATASGEGVLRIPGLSGGRQKVARTGR